MDLVRIIVGLGRGIREKNSIKVRQTLKSILVDGSHENIISDLTPLITEELNVKEVIYEKDLSSYINYQLKPDFKVAGPMLGRNIKAFGNALGNADPSDFVAQLENSDKVDLDIGGGEILEITKEMVDVRIDAKEGFAVAMENNVFAVLDTGLDADLVNEGYVREIISKVQQLRKQNSYEMMDNINIYLNADDEIAAAVKEYRDYIMKETLAHNIDRGDDLAEYNINGHKTGIGVEKI